MKFFAYPLSLAFATFVFVECSAGYAGNITGTVRAQGKEGAPSDVAGGKYGSRQFKFVERVNYEEMRDFVVYIDGPIGTNVAAPPSEPKQVITRRPVVTGATVKQAKATFDPHVLPVMVGTTVEWPNLDDILHNVFSFSETKQFDLGLYKAPAIEKVTFDKLGRVDVFCSIHSRMNCIVLVLENPYFASVSSKGNYTIPNVPAGTYKLKAWHERLPVDAKEVVVPEAGEVHVDFVLGIKNLPKR
jgi:plastocyanin